MTKACLSPMYPPLLWADVWFRYDCRLFDGHPEAARYFFLSGCSRTFLQVWLEAREGAT